MAETRVTGATAGRTTGGQATSLQMQVEVGSGTVVNVDVPFARLGDLEAAWPSILDHVRANVDKVKAEEVARLQAHLGSLGIQTTPNTPRS